ncbi:MAG: 2-(1,2-epoxy,2-dihydrophenyl)acetyl-CoA isomerase [Solirubrobacteraceae bacterium]|jgi:2-(1,2-epoxy-1,2-dihydrophenyl)acetyl-CoA isomerase|nr:2-(1,2-epoxy,2-dihydrophenyl)acetyl-CoA isomerase [Solirubrobacteraceae bacterium]
MEAFALDIADGVARVRFTQGARGNPFDATSCAELSLVATECDAGPAVRSVLITAEGRFFSVGGDLASLGESREGLGRFIKNATVGFHSGVSRFARMDAPTVVAVHALAAGGGVSLVAACDFAIAARSATFYAAYPAIGLTVDGGGSYYLPRRVGTRRATAFYLRNETWTAEQALEYGLISEVVDDEDLAAAAADLAAELASGPTRAYGSVKNLLLASSQSTLEGQLELEAREMARIGATDDAWNAINAVARKERPGFEGR